MQAEGASALAYLYKFFWCASPRCPSGIRVPIAEEIDAEASLNAIFFVRSMLKRHSALVFG